MSKKKPGTSRFNPKHLGMDWVVGRPKVPGYYCINGSLKKYYFDGEFWNVPFLKNGIYIRKRIEVLIIKNHSKI